MINILEGLQGSEKYAYVGGKPKWIVMIGPGKVGKTKFLVGMMDHLRTAYFDCDPMQGTKPYTGTFFVCPTYEKFLEQFTMIDNNKAFFKIDLVVLDTIDGLYELIEKKVCRDYNTADLFEIKVPQVGNGYSIVNGIFTDIIARMVATGKIFISICHTKNSKIGKSEIIQQFATVLNLPPKLQQWVPDTADANFWLSVTTAEGSTEPFMRVTTSSTDPYCSYTGGCRPFPGLMEVQNEFMLKDYLIKNFKEVTPTEGETNV